MKLSANFCLSCVGERVINLTDYKQELVEVDTPPSRQEMKRIREMKLTCSVPLREGPKNKDSTVEGGQ